MKDVLELVDTRGHVIECEIVAIFRNDDKSYIAYTERNDLSNEKELLVSRFVKRGDKVELEDITSDNEWEFVEKYLKNEVFEVDDDTL